MKNKFSEEQGLTQAFEGLLEYNLVVRTDAFLNEKLLALKREFYFEYGEANRIYSTDNTPGYITIACFFAREEMEGTFIRWLQRICSRFNSFPVKTITVFKFLPAPAEQVA